MSKQAKHSSNTGKGQAPSSPILITGSLERVEATLKEYYEIEDWQGVRLLLAIASAHYLPGESLWVRLISASKAGKTELLRAIVDGSLHRDVPIAPNAVGTEVQSDVVLLEYVTPASFRGGLDFGKRILDRIRDKLVITLDLAPISGMRKDRRLELFALLRAVKDGNLSADYGTAEGHVLQTGKFDWILAATPVVESMFQMENLLGERFIDLKWLPGNREEMAYRAIENSHKLSSIRKKVSDEVCLLMEETERVAREKPPTLTVQEKRMLAKWANNIAICRSPIQKDKGHIVSMPSPELGTSLGQDFSRVALGLKMLGIEDWQPYIERLAWDCIPSVRAAMLRLLPTSPKKLAEATKLPLSTVNYHLADLTALEVIGDEQLDEDEYDLIVSGEGPRKVLRIALPGMGMATKKS